MTIESDFLTPNEATDLVDRFLFNNEFRAGFEKLTTEDLYMLEYVNFILKADVENERVEQIADNIGRSFPKWKETLMEELKLSELSQVVLDRKVEIEKLNFKSLHEFTRRERKRLIVEMLVLDEDKERGKLGK